VQLGEAWLAVEEVSTSDAEPALVVPAQSPSESDPYTSGTSATGEDYVPAGSIAGVLRLVRVLENEPVPPVGSGRERLLSRARSALGASALLAFRVVRGELAIAECSGAMPTEGVLDALSAAAARARRSGTAARFDTEGGAGLVSMPTASGWALAALPPGSDTPFEPGSADLVSYVAEHLLAEPADRIQTPPPEGGEHHGEPPVPPGMVVGSSPPMRELLRGIHSTIGSDLHVLLQGECGTGKELVARLIHAWGPCAKGPFVPINCAAIPAELFEAEMFGVHGRAATGVDPRPGHFTRAEGGTIFLDEIGDLREDLQAKLLRALQERQISPVGASGVRRIEVRVISASNRDLETLAREGKFRQDLYYRLRGRQFHVPALRERKEDLGELTLNFVGRFAAEHQRRVAGISRRALRLLSEHDWPGNIRELENACKAAVLLCPHGGIVGAEHFSDLRRLAEQAQLKEPSAKPPSSGTAGGTGAAPPSPGSSAEDDLRSKVDDLERRTIVEALERCDGNQTRAASLLGLSRYGLRLKMRRLGVTARGKKGEG
jgi:DNA-binding NtrC family response regulator